MNSQKSISIILPSYNESVSISETITSFYNQLPNAFFYIVDNNSNDDTHEIAEQTLAKLKASGCVVSEKRQGKGNAVSKAFREIESDIYILVDADNTYSSENITEMCTMISSNQADMVIGDRLSNNSYDKKNNRRFHSFGNRLFTSFVNVTFSSNIQDLMSGLRVMSKGFVKSFPIMSKGFELESEMTIHALVYNYRIKEIPIDYSNRLPGSFSKLSTFKDGFRILYYIVKLIRTYKPILLFSSISICFLLISLLLGYIVIMEFLISNYVYRIPTAILASGCMILSFLSFFTGLILDSQLRYHKFNFYLTQKSR